MGAVTRNPGILLGLPGKAGANLARKLPIYKDIADKPQTQQAPQTPSATAPKPKPLPSWERPANLNRNPPGSLQAETSPLTLLTGAQQAGEVPKAKTLLGGS